MSMASICLRVTMRAKRVKRAGPEERPDSSWFEYGNQRKWVTASYQEDGDVYLYVPRDGRYWLWHKSYWVGVPEYARDKDYRTGLHWVMSTYAEAQVSVLQAYYPELVIEGAP